MNKYLVKIAELEKEALNALKAREMAKKVGVIADHTSQWKWGLRQLRDNRGEALTGKALEKAKVRMGALDNTHWNILKNVQKQHPHGELGYDMRDGKIRGKIHKGQGAYLQINEAMGKSITDKHTKNQSFGHTHPDLSKLPGTEEAFRNAEIQFPQAKVEHKYRFGEGHAHRLADPSGLVGTTGKNITPLPKHQANRKSELHNRYLAQVHKRLGPLQEKMWNHMGTPEAEKATEKYKEISLGAAKKLNDVSIHMSGDLQTMAVHRSGRKYHIASPHLGVEGLHRTVGKFNPELGHATLIKHRKVFLQRDK